MSCTGSGEKLPLLRSQTVEASVKDFSLTIFPTESFETIYSIYSIYSTSQFDLLETRLANRHPVLQHLHAVTSQLSLNLNLHPELLKTKLWAKAGDPPQDSGLVLSCSGLHPSAAGTNAWGVQSWTGECVKRPWRKHTPPSQSRPWYNLASRPAVSNASRKCVVSTCELLGRIRLDHNWQLFVMLLRHLRRCDSLSQRRKVIFTH